MRVLGMSFSPCSGCCFSTKHASLRRKRKDWLARNQDNVPEWDDICLSADFVSLSVLVKYKADRIIFLLKINLFSP